MHKTVNPERKLTVEADAKPIESNTGFIITPPPSPHIAPTTEARNPTRSNTISISYFFLSIV